MYGGKRFVRSSQINNNIRKWKTEHDIGYFNSRIRNIGSLKQKLQNYDNLIHTSNHAEFQELKARINRIYAKTQPSQNRALQRASNTKKDELFYNIDILTPTDFINKFKNNNNKTFEFILKELSIYSRDNRIQEYENNFKYFLARIRGLCNIYKENASHENNIGNYVNKHLTNMLIITQMALIQYKINQNTFNKYAQSGLFVNEQFSPHELIEFRVRGQRQPAVQQYISENNAERDLINLYQSNNPKFSLDNMIRCAIIFKESCGMIKNVSTHFKSKNNVFYKEKLVQYLEAMYKYYYYSYVYYTKLVVKCLHNFNNALSKIIELLDPLVPGNPIEAQIIIYMIQKVMNNNFFIRDNNVDTTDYEDQLENILSQTDTGTLGLLYKLFDHKYESLINDFKTMMENIQQQYEGFIQQRYTLPTENIDINVNEIMVVGTQPLPQPPFNGTTVFNKSGATQNYPSSTKLRELGTNIQISLENAFVSSINDINKLAESYINYRNLLNENYTYPEESRTTRSFFGKTSDYFKQGLRAAKAGIRKTKVEYTPMPFNNQEVNIEENNTTNQLRNETQNLTKIVTNLDASKTYLNNQKLSNFIRTNDGKRVINIYDLSKRIQTNIESYRDRRNRSASKDAEKLYNISKSKKSYKELKDKSKNQIITKKNTSKNNALIQKMKNVNIDNANLVNIIAKLTAHKAKLDAVNITNINNKSLENRLAMLKTVKNAENDYLKMVPGDKLINTFKTKLTRKIMPNILSLAHVKVNFLSAKEPYNVNIPQLAQKITKLPIGNQSIKSIKELNNVSEKIKSNIRSAKRYSKETKLNKMSTMLDDAKTKYYQIKRLKESIDDNSLKAKECCWHIDNTITTKRHGNRDYNKIHMNPVSGSCSQTTHFKTYGKLIKQIEILYQKMLDEYNSLKSSDNIILGSLDHVKDCYNIINHNVKLINEKIFK